MVSSNMQVKAAAGAIVQRGAQACVAALNDVVSISTARTPFKDGDLRGRRRVTPLAKGAQAQWLSGHAAVQNLGQRAGARPFTNYTTPGTGKEFVQFGLNAVMPNFLRYFK